MLVQEVGYLAQRFYAMDDFEVYHSDLDDPNKPANDTRNVPDNQAAAGPDPLTGLNTTLANVQRYGVSQPSSDCFGADHLVRSRSAVRRR